MFICVELEVVLLLNNAMIFDLGSSPLGVASAQPSLSPSSTEVRMFTSPPTNGIGGKCYAANVMQDRTCNKNLGSFIRRITKSSIGVV